MKSLRLIVDIVLFAAGAATGVVWGVNHPAQANNFALREQIASSKAKIEVLQRVGDNPTAKQMLTDEQRKLADANQALASQAGN